MCMLPVKKTIVLGEAEASEPAQHFLCSMREEDKS